MSGNQETSSPHDNPAIHLHQVLAQEFCAVHGKELKELKHYNKVVEQYKKLKAEDREKPKPKDNDEPNAEDADKLRAIIQDIHDYNAAAKKEDDKKAKATMQDMHEHPRAALCLSGGGIRSATFALGILQGLARCGLLDKFHYLSTVSGGGYIGSWLASWIHHRTGETKGVEVYCADTYQDWDSKRKEALKEVISCLAEPNQEDPSQPEANPIRHLREYSNYLSPKLGFLSADTWTLVAIYLRNLILNWLVLVPLLAAVFAIPRLCVTIVASSPGRCLHIWLITLCIAGAGCLVWAIAYMGIKLPSNPDKAPATKPKKSDKRWGQRGFLWGCLLVLILSAAFLTTFWAWWLKYLGGHQPEHQLFWFAAFGVAVHVGAVSLIVIRAGRRPRAIDFVAVLFSGAVGGLLLWITATRWLPDLISAPDAYACFATPIFLAVLLLAMTLYIGIASIDVGKEKRKITDEDLEWLARAGAWVFIAVTTWVVVSVLVLFGPCFLQLGWKSLSAVGGISGLITVLLGTSAKTKAKSQDDNNQRNDQGISSLLINKAPELAAPLFAAFLVVLVSIGTTALIRSAILGNDQFFPQQAQKICEAEATPTPKPAKVSVTAVVESTRSPNTSVTVKAESKEKIEESWLPRGPLHHRDVVRDTPLSLALVTIFVFGGLGLVASSFVNVNIFSMHGMYRDRLIRAYLGASRPDHVRKPHPFTGFDKNDNIDMYCLWPQGEDTKAGDQTVVHPRPLFPVINIALNLVHGKSLAWQERKAESFTVSPLHCGSWTIGTGNPDPAERTKGYRRTSSYAGGITLGTAVTISGAAASPNMGYHSSPLVTFIMTLFNARLGWWLGNPGPPGDKTNWLSKMHRWFSKEEIYRRWYPKFGIKPIVEEALGLTDDENKYVYLSDGGHFENLGLYEMVLRRCRYIVVSDAGQDPECSFVDLGEAVRKIRIDLGIPIDFGEMFIYARSDNPTQNEKGRYCAIGDIRYKVIDGDEAKDGKLIYIKPACYGCEPRDIYEYYKRSPLFPHESTLNQFFTESQFESYRMLGDYTMHQLCGDDQIKDFPDFINRVESHLKTRPPTWLDQVFKHLS